MHNFTSSKGELPSPDIFVELKTIHNSPNFFITIFFDMLCVPRYVGVNDGSCMGYNLGCTDCWCKRVELWNQLQWKYL